MILLLFLTHSDATLKIFLTPHPFSCPFLPFLLTYLISTSHIPPHLSPIPYTFISYSSLLSPCFSLFLISDFPSLISNSPFLFYCFPTPLSPISSPLSSFSYLLFPSPFLLIYRKSTLWLDRLKKMQGVIFLLIKKHQITMNIRWCYVCSIYMLLHTKNLLVKKDFALVQSEKNALRCCSKV